MSNQSSHDFFRKYANIITEAEQAMPIAVEGEMDSNLGISQGNGRYGDSSDFESDVSTIEQALQKVQFILESSEWEDWMQSTDDNHLGHQARNMSAKMYQRVQESRKLFDQLYNYLSDLS